MAGSTSLLRTMLGPSLVQRMLVVFGGVVAMAGSVCGDYVSTVLGLGPSLYYRLDETEVGTVYDTSVPASAAEHDLLNVLDGDVNQTPGALAPYDTNSFLKTHGLVIDLFNVEGDLVYGNADFSVSIWAKPADFAVGDWGTYFFMGAAAVGGGFILNESGNGDGRVVPGVYGGNLMASDDPLVLNQWNHVGFTYDADAVTGKLFVNGKLQYTQDLAAIPTSHGHYKTLNIQEGASALGAIGGPSPIQSFNGGIDEFVFFQKTLADDDMLRLSNPEGKLPEPPEPPPAIVYNAADYAASVKALHPSVYYRLNETTVGVVTDSSGNNHHASHVPDVASSELNLIPGALNPDSAIHAAGVRVDLSGAENSLVEGSADFSVSLWVRPEDVSEGGIGTFLCLGSAEPGSALLLSEDIFPQEEGKDLVMPGVYMGDFGRSVNGMKTKEWNHVGFTYDADSTTAKLFLNGNLESTTVLEEALPGGFSELNIGSGASALGGIGGPDPAQPFLGGIDEFAFFQTTLTNEQIQSLAIRKVVPNGDYNANGELDAGDLDLQAIEIAAGTNKPAFDLTGDGKVNYDDRVYWVEDPGMKKSWIGDANLNGEFDSNDFVQVFSAGKYEVGGATATWTQGDWNGDLLFTSGDFVAAFASGGYEVGPRAAVSAVPEPSSVQLILLGLAGLFGWLCRRPA